MLHFCYKLYTAYLFAFFFPAFAYEKKKTLIDDPVEGIHFLSNFCEMYNFYL